MATVMDAPHAEVLHGQRLDGKVALVTGAGGELGHRVAVALGELGASVALNHRGAHDAQIQAAIARLDEAGIAGGEMRGDLASSARVASLFDEVVDRFDRLDVVVHTPGRVTKSPFAEITDEEFEASVDQNLRAAFYVLLEAARRVANNGRIVTITTSITGVTTPYYSIYAGHKAATEHYVRGLAKEPGVTRYHRQCRRSRPDQLTVLLRGGDRAVLPGRQPDERRRPARGMG